MADPVDCRRLRQSSRPLRILAVPLMAVVMFTLSACAPGSLRELAKSTEGAVEVAAAAMMPSSKAAGDPLLEYLAEAREDEVRDIDDPTTGNRFRVKAGRVYHAASGRLCRRYVAGTPSAPENSDNGLACRDANGDWVRVGLLVPVSP
ncbi:MAG: hypothetical protein OXU81_00165 [Gammaproteobacteria bacterium]|nr:hypothetical protein [Gammaproteobacteria bacterium]